MAYSHQDLEAATLHIREGLARIRALEEDIAAFRKQGHYTSVAEATLTLFMDVLGAMREHEAAIRDDISAREAAGAGRGRWKAQGRGPRPWPEGAQSAPVSRRSR